MESAGKNLEHTPIEKSHINGRKGHVLEGGEAGEEVLKHRERLAEQLDGQNSPEAGGVDALVPAATHACRLRKLLRKSKEVSQDGDFKLPQGGARQEGLLLRSFLHLCSLVMRLRNPPC